MISEIFSFLGLSQRHMHKVSDKRLHAGKLLTESATIIDELYYLVEGDRYAFYEQLTVEDRAEFDDAFRQITEFRKMSDEHFQMLQNPANLSLRRWDNLINHLERQVATCERVKTWYMTSIHHPLHERTTDRLD